MTPKEELLRILSACSAVHYPNQLHGDTIEYKGAEYQLVGKELSISEVESWVETHGLDEFLFLDHGSPDRNGRAGVFVGDRNALTTMYSLYVGLEKPYREDWSVYAYTWTSGSGRLLLVFEPRC